MKQRIFYLDVLRATACLAVILMHSPQPYSASGMVLSTISMLCAPCIGLFLMVSGALLLPVKEPTAGFLKRRLTRIVAPVLFWSIINIVADYYKKADIAVLLKSLISLPFTNSANGIFWFVYTIAGLYLVAPVISPWLQKVSKREIECFLGLWAVTLCYPIIGLFADINESNSGILYYFTGYAGYFVLGYYLHNYTHQWNNAVIAALFAVPLMIAATCKLTHVEVDFYKQFWYLSITVASMSAAVFMAAKKFFDGKQPSTRLAKITVDFSKCSFGIYLIHALILQKIVWRLNLCAIPNGGGIVETFVATVIVSYAAVYLLSYLPLAEHIVGYRRR